MEHFRWEFLHAIVFTGLLVRYLRPRAVQIGLVDRPDHRKRHRGTVPLVGGIAIFIGYVLAVGPVVDTSPRLMGLLLGGGLLIVIGALDDYFDFRPLPRLAAQVMAVGVMIISGVSLQDIGALGANGGLLALGILAVPFTVFATVGAINALNMMDGVDGLSGSVGVVAIAAMLIVSIVSGANNAIPQLLALLGCVMGFLFFNMRSPIRRKALAFLGDAGSMFLGFALTWYLISLSQGTDRAFPPAAAVWFVALPLMDAVYNIGRRLAAGRSPLGCDRQHLHHLFIRSGVPVQSTVWMLCAAATLLASVGVAGSLLEWPDVYLAAGFATLFCLYCTVMHVAWRNLLKQQSDESAPHSLPSQHATAAQR